MMIKVLDLFAGIGGFSLGLERAGMKTIAFVEIDPYCQRVLKKHWFDVPIFSDIKTFGKGVFNETVDLVCGGFPCQPFSVAGRRKGTDDNRYLWPEMFRVIQEYKPTWVIAENVRGIISIQQGMVFEKVCSDLEGEGYQVQSFVIPACAVNAPHRRDRVWIIANRQCLGWETWSWKGIQSQEQVTKRQDIRNTNTERNAFDPDITGSRIGLRVDRNGQEKNEKWQRFPQFKLGTANHDVADPTGKRLEGKMWEKLSWAGRRPSSQDRREFNAWDENWYEIAARFCRMDNGISNRVDRLKCLGNSVIPQIIEIIGTVIINITNTISNVTVENVSQIMKN